MYEGEVYLKVSSGLFYAVSSESSMIGLSDSDEIYPLIPDYNQVVKSTLGKYAKVISGVKDVIDND